MRLDVDRVRDLRPETELRYFPTLGSTMTEAAGLAQAGAPHGTAVIADEQTAGLGRLGRRWISEREVGLYCSIVSRLPIEPAKLPVVSLALGLATATAITRSTDLICDLRWPNDVLIGTKKAAGILTHLVDNCVIAGIGINVNNSEFAADLRTPATSLRLEIGRFVSRELLLVELLKAVDEFYQLLIQQGCDAILRAFSQTSSYVLDRQIAIEESGNRGKTAGLDRDGFLLVRLENGTVERISSGGIRLV